MVYHFKFITNNGVQSYANIHAKNMDIAIKKFKEWWIEWDSQELPNYWIDGIWSKE